MMVTAIGELAGCHGQPRDGDCADRQVANATAVLKRLTAAVEPGAADVAALDKIWADTSAVIEAV